MNVVFLEYNFIFDPSELWSDVWQFEADLAAFFKERNLEARNINQVGGQAGKRILYIKKTEAITAKVQPVEPNNPMTSKKNLNLAKKNRGYDGKYK